MALQVHTFTVTADRDFAADSCQHWQANAAQFDFVLPESVGTFEGEEVHLEIRQIGLVGGDGLLARATATPSGSELTLNFTGPQMNQSIPAGAEFKEFGLWLYVQPAGEHVTLWRGTLKLTADETTASETEQPPDVVAFNLTQAQADALYAPLAGYNDLAAAVEALEGAPAPSEDAVLFTEQALDAGQKAQALANIGASATGHTHTKADVGLGNVDNTADADKPVSTLQAAAIASAAFNPAIPGEIGGTTPNRATFRSATSDQGSVIAEFKRADGQRALAIKAQVQAPGAHPAFEFNPDKTLLQGSAVVFWLYQEGFVSFRQSHAGATMPSPRFTFVGNFWDGSTNYDTGGGFYFVPNGTNNGKLVMEAGGTEGLAVFRHENRTPVVQVGAADFTDGQLNIQANWSGKIGVVVRGASGQTAALQSWQSSTGVQQAAITADGALILKGANILGDFTALTVPDAASNERGIIWVNDESGGACPAYSDGTGWKRFDTNGYVEEA